MLFLFMFSFLLLFLFMLLFLLLVHSTTYYFSNVNIVDTLFIPLYEIVYKSRSCGGSGSMSACHAAGSGSIPGRDKFPG